MNKEQNRDPLPLCSHAVPLCATVLSRHPINDGGKKRMSRLNGAFQKRIVALHNIIVVLHKRIGAFHKRIGASKDKLT